MAKKLTYQVSGLSMHPFPEFVLCIAGDWKAALKSIDRFVDRRPGGASTVKLSDAVRQVMQETEAERSNDAGVMIANPGVLDNVIIVWTRDARPAPAILAHECLHAVLHITDAHGVDDRNHETEAYMFDRLFDHLFDVCTTKRQQWKSK